MPPWVFETRSLALCAYVLTHGGRCDYERGVFVCHAPWPLPEALERYKASPEKRFDAHILYLRNLKRISS